MINLIVNADDFGLTERVNLATIEGHRNGIITSATLMANGPAFHNAVRQAQLERTLGVGVHLNLSEGHPVSNLASVATLIDRNGRFYLSPMALVRKLTVREIDLNEVERELRAQIERALDAGIPITHLDGHKHFQFFPLFLKILIRLANDYGIRGIRCCGEWTVELFRLAGRNWRSSPTILKQHLNGRILSLFARLTRRKLVRAGLKSPDILFGITSTGFMDARYLETVIARLPQGTSELVCHPGYVDKDLIKTPTRLLKQRENDLLTLIQPQVKEWISRRGVQLINYRQLCEGT